MVVANLLTNVTIDALSGKKYIDRPQVFSGSPENPYNELKQVRRPASKPLMVPSVRFLTHHDAGATPALEVSGS